MSFTVNVTRRVRLQLWWLTDAEQRELGQFAVETMQKRIRSGIALNDQPAPPLSAPYAKAKQRRGIPPLRNLTYTGALLNNMQVIETGERIRIGFPDPKQAIKAGVNQDRVPMIGLSRFDQQQIVAKHDELLARSVGDIIRELVA